MSASFSCTSPCKLNEFLYITGRRPDGYHSLQTLFVVLNAGDRLDFETSDNGEITLECSLDIPPEQNLIMKAARLMHAYVKKSCGCRIRAAKRLPAGGGVGGGSGNAATALLVLNRLWKLRLPEEELLALAAGLGADVPIFIKGKTCFAQGTGTELLEIEYPQRWYVVCNPGCKAPTAELFADPHLKRDSKKRSLRELLSAPFENAFTPVVSRRFPEVRELISRLSEFGKARMSGSGSSCFVSFEKEEQARACERALLSEGRSAFAAQSCLKNPIIAALDAAGL
ncbi:MAG: 4-(cytidine 5'-diphospho)-2-C-methyl-D-erythritol kinase [Succinivibrio sp.]|jgi:4-diphosphocytidyl-2-C-methyl-D-erythritol kinase|nr:4-(cytidine 5'-diphospho)-2-C-methyl-D-erythritol kinase [Succinivibrio sp.]